MENIVKFFEVMHGNYLIMIAVGIFLFTYVIKKSNIVDNRILPLVAITIGIVLGVFATWVTGNDMIIGAFDGIIAGLIAAGGKDLITLFLAFVNGDIKDWNTVEDVLDDGKLNGSNKKDKD